MPLWRLYCAGTKVTDFSPLKSLPLKEIEVDVKPESLEALRAIKTLENINDLPAAEFWKKYPQAGAAQPEAAALPKELCLDLGAGVKIEMVLVKAGEFMMGADDGAGCEKPIHKVKISQPYYIGKYDVTVAEFRAFADAMKFQTDAEKHNRGWAVSGRDWKELPGINWRNPGFRQDDNHPVVVVTWNDAQEFCKWATKLAGRTVRLPTEAEWEYAARGPQSSKYPWGDKGEGIMANVADASLRRAGYSMA